MEVMEVVGLGHVVGLGIEEGGDGTVGWGPRAGIAGWGILRAEEGGGGGREVGIGHGYGREEKRLLESVTWHC